MRVVVWAMVMTVALGGAAGAAEPVSQTFAVPVERAWSTTLAVLKHLGWDIDKEDRAIGWITTDSRRVGGEDYGVYAKGTRHRLRVTVKAAGARAPGRARRGGPPGPLPGAALGRRAAARGLVPGGAERGAPLARRRADGQSG